MDIGGIPVNNVGAFGTLQNVEVTLQNIMAYGEEATLDNVEARLEIICRVKDKYFDDLISNLSHYESIDNLTLFNIEKLHDACCDTIDKLNKVYSKKEISSGTMPIRPYTVCGKVDIRRV